MELRPIPPNFWDREKVERLKDLWCRHGLSAAQCAMRLGATRNAVISKIHRLGISERHVIVKRTAPHHLVRRKKKPAGAVPSGSIPGSFPVKQMKQFRATVEPLPPERVSHVPLDQRKKLADIQDDQCRNIFGDTSTADHHYCHRPQAPGLPYCEECAAVNYLMPKVTHQQPERGVKMARAKERELA